MRRSPSLAVGLNGFAAGAALGFATTVAIGLGGPAIGLAAALAAVLLSGALALRPRQTA
jgi:hypothetical protein